MKSPYRLLAVILAVVLYGFQGISGEVWAQGAKYPAYSGHVNDFAKVIDAGTRQRLETILTNFESLTGAQIAAVVVPSLNDRPVEEYALGLYRAWGIGAKSGDNKNKGALLLVALQDRKTRLEVGYGLEGDLPDGLAGEIIRRMRPSLQQGAYSQAMETGVRTLVDTLAEKWNVSLAGIDRRFAYRAPPAAAAPSPKAIALMAVVFIFIFIIFMGIAARTARKRGMRMGGGQGAASDLWWLAPIIFNRGGGSFGGGSWNSSGGWGSGGGDSGGGGSDWGGFGGGSGGGGGASDSW
ncbi:MAG: TPM domain-containing protein [Blastocatellia bacterium]